MSSEWPSPGHQPVRPAGGGTQDLVTCAAKADPYVPESDKDRVITRKRKGPMNLIFMWYPPNIMMKKGCIVIFIY
jgi:hypothetical protein